MGADSMHRFYIAPEETGGKVLTLSSAQTHHAKTVLRIREGERVSLLDGAGHEYLCETRGSERSGLEFRVVQTNSIPPLPCQITLIQALTKGKSMDLIVQKATELGAHRIIPVISERSVPELGEEKVAKWMATAIESIKQCGSAWLPKIDPPRPAMAVLTEPGPWDLRLVASLQPNARHPRERCDEYRRERGSAPRSVAVWVGPEGDFTPAEIHAISGSGAWPITLGPLILRSETAAIYCLSILNYELQTAATVGHD